MKTFRNVGGLHVELVVDKDGKKINVPIKTGQVFDSERDLQRLFPEKFVEVRPVAEGEVVSMPFPGPASPAPIPTAPVSAPVPSPISVPTDHVPVSKPVPTGERRVSKLGKEVTERFPVATELGLVVLRKGAQYVVVEEEDLEEAVKGPAKKPIIEAYLREEKAKADAEK